MKLYDVVEWNEHEFGVNDVIAYRHEAENFNTHTQLIVHASQEAIFYKDGMALDLFEAGRHTLTTQNLPLLGKLINIPTGGVTPFKCEVFFVNKVFLNDLKWGTPAPITIEDPIEGVNVHVRAAGLFGAHIEDSRKFLIKVVGTQGLYTKEELSQYLRAKTVERVTDLIGKAMVNLKIGILNVSSQFAALSDEIKGQMKPFFADFGISLDNFSFMTINAPDEDLRAINEAKIQARIMDRESEALARKRAREGYTYQQERGFDVYQTAAGNESSMGGGLMGAGIGLGMGMGIGGAFGQGIAGIGQGTMANMNMNQPQGYQPPQGVGQPQQNPKETACPHCGAAVAVGSKFCNNCGNKLTATCPSCGAELPPGSKFCNNCGQKI